MIAKKIAGRVMSEEAGRLCDTFEVETFVCELTHIDQLGGNRRLIFTVPSADAPAWKDVVVKVIVPAEYMVQLGFIITNDGD